MRQTTLSFAALLFFLTFIGCHNNDQSGTSTVAQRDSTSLIGQIKVRDSVKSVPLLCDSVLLALVKSSSIPSSLKEYLKELKVESNGLSDSILAIRLYHLNDANFEVGLANLELNAKKRLLFDVTADEENPKLLTCDTNLLNYEIAHCINWKDNQ